jgi:predicted GTPase
MNERQARDVTLLEAFETAEPPHPAWGEADRAWADRVAREAVPAGASAERFIADRAAHALHRLGEREPALVRTLSKPARRAGAMAAVVAIAFALGVAADAVGSGRHVNLLAPPLWATIAWNAVVYVLLAGFLLRDVARRGETPPEGPIARAARAVAERGPMGPRWTAAGRSGPGQRFATLWSARRGPLGATRARMLLHAAAAALALGLVAGLYARGLVLDYRAVWQSTLLDGPAAHAVVTTAFAPASRLSGIPLPDLGTFEAMRVTAEGASAGPRPPLAAPAPAATSAPPATATASATVATPAPAPTAPTTHSATFAAPGAPAAPWLHLIALTVALAVVVPRVVLLLGSAALASWRRRHVALPIESPYFQRLARLRGSGGPVRLAVVPHGAAPSAQVALAARTLFADAFGPALDLRLLPPVPPGREDDAPPGLAADTTHAAVLVDLAATPEPEVHGRLVASLARALPPGAPIALVLDASGFARRFAGLDGRVADRRAAWQRFGSTIGLVPLVVELEAAAPGPDLDAVQAAFANPDPALLRTAATSSTRPRRPSPRRRRRRARRGPAMTPSAAPAARPAGTVSLALVSHTNAGKTTLARTLLRRDIGTVRDAPHVTEFSDAHVLVEAPGGERLVLWDTPGFGDTFRLATRLRQTANPIVRFLTEAWDRWRDRPFWASQQALRTVRDDADVLLYLVNASESPAGAGYVRPEMEILAWIGKPVVVLLNQLGRPREPAAEDAEAAAWRAALTAHPAVRAVLPLDAFARCWVQELLLFETIESVLSAERREAMARLVDAWRAERLVAFDESMRVLAASLGRLAAASEPVPAGATVGDRLKAAGAALGWKGTAGDDTPSEAERALGRRLDGETRSSTQALLALHGLSGAAEGEILGRTAALVDVRLRVDEGQAALWGGALTGAIAGLKADVLSGGLTLGGGCSPVVSSARSAAPAWPAPSTSPAAPTARRWPGAPTRSTPCSRLPWCATSRWPTSAAVAASGARARRRRTGSRCWRGCSPPGGTTPHGRGPSARSSRGRAKRQRPKPSPPGSRRSSGPWRWRRSPSSIPGRPSTGGRHAPRPTR